MLWDEPSPDESEDIIKRFAKSIYKYEMVLVAILFLESIKPIASVGGQFARYMVAPFIPFIGEESIPYLATFQDKDNVEKLIQEIERLNKQNEIKHKKEKDRMKEQGIETQKKGWRRYLPF